MLRPCPGPFHFIQLCSPVSAKSVPAGDSWVHEPKMDGYRLQVVKDGPTVRLFSRRGYDWTKRLTVLAEALRAICLALTAHRTSLACTQPCVGSGRTTSPSSPSIYCT
jgi:ATP-dependent DNA ligase